jgi:two-component system, NtrC family, response regulator HydG
MSRLIALLVSACPSLVEAVRGLAASAPHLRVEVCPGVEAARARVRDPDVGLLLAHLTPGGEVGLLGLLRGIAAGRRLCPTVVLLEPYREDEANAFRRAGATDCLGVPVDLPRLPGLLGALTCPPCVPPSPGAAAPTADVVVEGMGVFLDQVRRVAPQAMTILLTGETGTGKTRLARLIHELSGRRAEPFLVVDCGALSASLVESELFGHAKGAFTGADRERAGKLAAAGRGTLLLDEVNSLPHELQGKLLRAVDERRFEPVGSNASRPVRARLVVASNKPLEAEVAEGRFRADLFYRLNVLGFFLPPLRDRRGAIAPLARRFLGEFAGKNRPDVLGLSAAALSALEGYGWPGNVRELRNVVERAVALCEGPLIEPHDLPEAIRGGAGAACPAPGLSLAPATLVRSAEEAEVRRITEALARQGENRLRAARELGISRTGLYKKLHKYRLM